VEPTLVWWPGEGKERGKRQERGEKVKEKKEENAPQ